MLAMAAGVVAGGVCFGRLMFYGEWNIQITSRIDLDVSVSVLEHLPSHDPSRSHRMCKYHTT